MLLLKHRCMSTLKLSASRVSPTEAITPVTITPVEAIVTSRVSLTEAITPVTTTPVEAIVTSIHAALISHVIT